MERILIWFTVVYQFTKRFTIFDIWMFSGIKKTPVNCADLQRIFWSGRRGSNS